jgi:5-methylcytosine-specific restriction endonuclease McrA
MNFCKCGCEKEVINSKNRFINGHNVRVQKRQKLSIDSKRKMSESHKGQIAWNKGKTGIYSEEVRKKISESLKGHKHSLLWKINHSKKMKGHKPYNELTLERINKRYSFFSKIEEMRYNPDKPEEKEIQVHCKNHCCKNSKEKSGWFTPIKSQLYERIRQLNDTLGNDGMFFYCSDNCKQTCDLFNVHGDPCKETKKSYTQEEYQTFRQFVLKRDQYICQFCGEKATDVHHERPQKLEPFFVLDPDYAWSYCKDCHYKFGHQGECNTGNLSSKLC